MIDTLTSLRLFFALLVFASHIVIISDKFSGHMFVEGYVGVSFFFILSGFIIAHNYSDRIATPSERKSYYIARIARIYPLHLLTLVAAIAIYGFAVKSPISWAHLATSATLTNAYIPRSDFFFALNAPAWSLCCEQLFYATFPFVLPFIKKPAVLLSTIIIAIIITIIGAQITPEAYIKGVWYVNPIMRYPDFVMGIATFYIYRKVKGCKIGTATATALETASILLFLLFYATAEELPKIYRYSFYYWLPIVAVILVFALQKGALSRILSNRIFILGGEISYGIYLTQLLVINTIGKHCTAMSTSGCVAVALATTILISYTSYKYYEKPMNHIVKRWLGYKR